MACSASTCVCAAKATCSCGKQPALKCNCDKANVENAIPTNACACGKRASSACTCGAQGVCDGTREGEIDFTDA